MRENMVERLRGQLLAESGSTSTRVVALRLARAGDLDKLNALELAVIKAAGIRPHFPDDDLAEFPNESFQHFRPVAIGTETKPLRVCWYRYGRLDDWWVVTDIDGRVIRGPFES